MPSRRDPRNRAAPRLRQRARPDTAPVDWVHLTEALSGGGPAAGLLLRWDEAMGDYNETESSEEVEVVDPTSALSVEQGKRVPCRYQAGTRRMEALAGPQSDTVAVKNVTGEAGSSETAPAYGVLQLDTTPHEIDNDTQQFVWRVVKPGAISGEIPPNGAIFLFNLDQDLEDEAIGQASWQTPATVLARFESSFQPQDATTFHEEIGPRPDDWRMSILGRGFISVGAGEVEDTVRIREKGVEAPEAWSAAGARTATSGNYFRIGDLGGGFGSPTAESTQHDIFPTEEDRFVHTTDDDLGLDVNRDGLYLVGFSGRLGSDSAPAGSLLNAEIMVETTSGVQSTGYVAGTTQHGYEDEYGDFVDWVDTNVAVVGVLHLRAGQTIRLENRSLHTFTLNALSLFVLRIPNFAEQFFSSS